MRISVIMSAFNSEQYIGEAIESILIQTYGDFEFIIIDDGSTDGTPDVIKRFATLDKRIRVITHKNEGPSRCLNIGIREAKYEWIARMDDDDISLKNRFEEQVKAVKTNPEVIAWGTYAYHINKKNKILSLSKVGPTSIDQFYRLTRNGEFINIIDPSALLHKKTIIKVGGYNPFFDSCEDLELFLRLAEVGPILAIPEPLILRRIHGSSMSTQQFFKQNSFTCFLLERQKDKARGNSPPTFNEYCQNCEDLPPLKKLNLMMNSHSRFYYRKFAVMASNEEYLKALFYLLLSSLLSPKYSLPRVWHQRLAKSTRKFLIEEIPSCPTKSQNRR